MDNISLVNGKEHYAGEIPTWHKLGKVVGKKMTSTEALQLANLDYNVELQPVTTLNGMLIPNHYATVRTDVEDGLPFGVVGNRYTIIQNRDAFTFFDSIIEKDEAIYESVGALGNGERIFLSAKLPDRFEVAKSCVDMHLCFFNSHDGTMPAIALFTPVYVVCQNTMNMALKNCQNRVSLRHTTNVKERFDQAIKLMGIKEKYVERLHEVVTVLNAKKMDDKSVRRVVEMVFIPNDEMKQLATGKEISTRTKNIVEQVMNYYFEHPFQKDVRGTAYGVYNAVTGYFQNVRDYKTEEHKMNSILLGGTADKFSQRALDLLLVQ